MCIQKSKAREQRVKKLVENLERKLSIYVEACTGGPGDEETAKSWREICRIEAEYVSCHDRLINLILNLPPLASQGSEDRILRCRATTRYRTYLRLEKPVSRTCRCLWLIKEAPLDADLCH